MSGFQLESDGFTCEGEYFYVHVIQLTTGEYLPFFSICSSSSDQFIYLINYRYQWIHPHLHLTIITIS